ncbi:diphthine synthase [Candidatus Woesearchaeota archaeon]|nr:MAG: diphthine synthase [Candidatus Woesearchaeota archaeon]
MTLYLIGIGLANEEDISVRGLTSIKTCEHVYLEGYTSILESGKDRLEALYAKPITILDRDDVEKGCERMVEQAKTKNVAFLAVGDVFSATTHIALYLEAKKRNVPVTVIHGASILTAVGKTGLELYKFGKTTSIPFLHENVTTPYTVLVTNKNAGLHTLFLLDLTPNKNRFLTIPQAARYLLEQERQQRKGVVDETTMGVACSRLGWSDETITYATLHALATERVPTGKPPSCLIIPADLHFIEEEALAHYSR